MSDCCGQKIGTMMAEILRHTKFCMIVEKDGQDYIQMLKFRAVKSKSDYVELENDGEPISYHDYRLEHDVGIDFDILAENWVKKQ